MPTSPPAHVTFRPFAGPSDYAAMVACANASFAADETGFFRTEHEVARDYAAFTSCVPERDVWIAQAGTEIAGYVRSWPWAQADGLQLYSQFAVVAPRWRRQGIGTVLHAWLEQRQRTQAAAEHPGAPRHAHHAYIVQGETARAALLEKAGYTPERYIFTMLRPTLDQVADFALPEGLELRPAQPEHYRAIWDAHGRAFQDHWGQGRPSPISPPRWPRHGDGCAKRGAANSGLLASRATKQTPHAGASPKGKPAARHIAALPFACVAVLHGTQGALHCTALQAFAGAK